MASVTFDFIAHVQVGQQTRKVISMPEDLESATPRAQIEPDASRSSNTSHKYFIKALAEGLDGLARYTDSTPPKHWQPGEFSVRNVADYLVLYYGDEVVAKVSPEDADQLVRELKSALKKRPGDFDHDR